MTRRSGFLGLLMLSVLALGGCANTPFFHTEGPPARAHAEPPGVDPMVAALQAWRSAGIEDYTWQIRFTCECSLTDLLEVTVADGKVTRVRRSTGDVALTDVEGFPLTVDALLGKAIDAVKAGGTAGATWPGDNGVPSELHIDPIPNAVDDELNVAVIRLDPASSPSPR